MTKCRVYACPNKGTQYYLIDPVTRIWLCEDCINQAEQLVQQEIEKRRELVHIG